MTSYAKPEVHNVLHCRQWRTEPRHGHMYGKFREDCTCFSLRFASGQTDRSTNLQAGIHTDRHADRNRIHFEPCMYRPTPKIAKTGLGMYC